MQASEKKEYSIKGQLGLRIAFALVLLACFAGTMFSIQRNDVITNEECLRDYSFEWTNGINKYLSERY